MASVRQVAKAVSGRRSKHAQAVDRGKQARVVAKSRRYRRWPGGASRNTMRYIANPARADFAGIDTRRRKPKSRKTKGRRPRSRRM